MGFLRYQFLFVIATILPSSPCMAQGEEGMEYERNSMHVMMIKHLNQRYDDIIEDVFLQTPFPERFNDHNLGVKTVSFAELDGDQSGNITSFIDQVNLGQKMVAKWFSRDKRTGSFNMELVKERGFYNATLSQKNVARASYRGMALLEDAGENLISKTFLLVNDISYVSKGSGNWVLKSIASIYSGSAAGLQKSLESIGGFQVDIKSYLFQLVWDEEIAQTFYTQYYTEDGESDGNKVKAFAGDKALFKMKYVGKTESMSRETNFKAVKDPKAFLVKVCTQTMDQNIAQLQHQYADFRIKAPLLSVDPIKADVGMKEDITEDSRFEVLERVIDDNGKVNYERVGIIRPVKGKIKDNRYMVTEEESKDAALDATEFEKVSGKGFYQGMLIREIK